LVASDVDVIVTTGTPGAMAAKNGTTTIPIVAVGMADPVRSGLIRSLSHPGGNLTGISMGYGPEFTGKWLEMLQETVPRLASLAVIANPQNAVLQVLRADLETLARHRNVRVHFLPVTQSASLDDVFEQAQRKAQAALLLGDPLTMSNRTKITSLAISNRLPVMYNVGAFAEDGGLMSYAPDVESQVQRAAEYVDKILRGAAPGELPVEQPTKYLLTLNLKAARSIGLGFPETMLLRADRVLQ
jgi:putative tryptophan/tyrosine transport system substrate-binding protein